MSPLVLAILFAARIHAVHPPQHILWIGAHPDDESLVAPILGRSCVEGRDACSIVVMTRGEGGGDPSVRSSEMQRAAGHLHAALVQWDFADVMTDVDATWSAEAGGRDALVSRILAAIVSANPTIVCTFDPNHGSSCHPAHRETGALVIAALSKLGPSAPPLYFVETTIEYAGDGFVFGSAAPDATSIDARATWHYLVEDIEIHASQFTAGQVESLKTIADSERVVALASVPAQKYSCGK